MSDNGTKNNKIGTAARFHGIMRLFFVPKCIICGVPLSGEGEMCPDCLEKWAAARRKRCSKCRKSAEGCECRPSLLFSTDTVGEKSLISLVFYRGREDDEGSRTVKTLIDRAKTSSSLSSSRFAARELSSRLMRHFIENGENPSDWKITYAPRPAKRIRKYGFDQGRDLARCISKYTGIEFEACFMKNKSRAQKALSSPKRQANADGAYKLKKNVVPTGAKYVIVDDIITTGATVSACARALSLGGAKAVFPISVARTDKRKKLKRKMAERPWFTYSAKK